MNDTLLRELDDLKITLHKKSMLLDSMSLILHDLQMFVAQYRIVRSSNKYLRTNKQLTTLPSPPQEKILSKDDAFRQETSIRAVCGMYSRDAEEAKTECKKAQDKLRVTLRQFEVEKLEILMQAKQSETALKEAFEIEKAK